MRRLPTLLTAWLLWVGPLPPVFAQAPLPAAFQIGVAGAVRGSVELTTPGQIGRIIQSGEPLFLQQEVTTDAQGHLQILLLDETVFTIGPNSALVLDAFVYDPTTQAGKIAARATKGVFRFVTGKIARQNPQDMQVALPSGLIGIRGTIVAGRIEGQKALVVLLGPGPKNNTGDRPGQVSVSSVVGTRTQEVTITRPGFGTEIAGPGIPPTPPAQVPAAELDALTQALTPPAPAQPAAPQADPAAAGPPVAQQAGQTTVVALASVGDLQTTSQLSQDLDDQSTTATQQAATTSAKVADGTATKDQLRTIETGVFHYKFQGNFTQTVKDGSSVNIVGTIQAALQIDFGSRNIGGGNSFVEITPGSGGDISGRDDLMAHSFATGSGDAIYTDGCLTNDRLTVTVTIKNQDGVIAKQATGESSFDNSADVGASLRDVGSSSPQTVTRESGSAPASF